RAFAAIALSGKYLYVGDFGVGLHVLDVSDPSHPVRLGGIGSNPGSLLFNPSQLLISDNKLFMSAGSQGLLIFDLFHPFELRPITSSDPNATFAFQLQGSRGAEVRVQRSTDLLHWEPDWKRVTLGGAPTQ